MILSFKHKGLKEFFLTGHASKLNKDHLKKLRLVLAKLDAATHIKDLNFPGSQLHVLTGDLKGYYSISITGNWRLIFKFHNGDASFIDLIDYH